MQIFVIVGGAVFFFLNAFVIIKISIMCFISDL